MLYKLARTALFQLDPEAAHDLALKSLALARPGAALLYGGAPKPGEARRVMGLDFPNPVGLAAGLDKNGAYIDALAALGFGFIEVISPCPTLYQRRNKMGDGLDTMKYYKQASKIRHGAPTGEVALSRDGQIIVGKFVDRADRPDYLELLNLQMKETLGEEYAGAEVESCE